MRERFFKAHGNGNDFIIFIANHYNITSKNQNHYQALSRAIATRYRHIGCDQVIFLSLGFPQSISGVLPDSTNIVSYCKRNNFYRFINTQQSLLQLTANNNRLLNAQMFIFNADGTAAGACGNATRCAAFLLYRLSCNRIKNSSLKVGTRHLEYSIATMAGSSSQNASINSLCGQVIVNMGGAEWRQLASTTLPNAGLVPTSYVNVGNEHIIIDISDLPNKEQVFADNNIFSHIIPGIIAQYPQGINVSLVRYELQGTEATNSELIRVRTYERGVGETQMCGSACNAALIALQRAGRIKMPLLLSPLAIAEVKLDLHNSVTAQSAGGALQLALLGNDNSVFSQDKSQNDAVQALMQGPAEISCYGEIMGFN